jgi:hypothetical protein
MKTGEEFKQYYEEKLGSELTVLRKKRRLLIWKKVLGNIIPFPGIILFLIIAFYSQLSSDAIALLTVIVIMIFSAIPVFILGNSEEKYINEFNNEIIARIIRFTTGHEDFKTQSIYERDVLEDCGIFPTPRDSSLMKVFEGINGGSNYIIYRFSAHFEHIKAFNGYIIESSFNKEFSGQTIIYPVSTENFLLNLHDKILHNLPPRIEIEDPDFHKAFAVYGTDQVEARYLVTPALMQKLLNIHEKLNHDIFCSFSKSNMYIAVNYKRPEFLANTKKLPGYDMLLLWFHDLNDILNLVFDFRLGISIWKQSEV